MSQIDQVEFELGKIPPPRTGRTQCNHIFAAQRIRLERLRPAAQLTEDRLARNMGSSCWFISGSRPRKENRLGHISLFLQAVGTFHFRPPAYPLAEKAPGLLLHSSVGDRDNEAVVIQNHPIRYATVDLGAAAKEIREQFLHVMEVSHAS